MANHFGGGVPGAGVVDGGATMRVRGMGVPLPVEVVSLVVENVITWTFSRTPPAGPAVKMSPWPAGRSVVVDDPA